VSVGRNGMGVERGSRYMGLGMGKNFVEFC
jgi:hypothetical protein